MKTSKKDIILWSIIFLLSTTIIVLFVLLLSNKSCKKVCKSVCKKKTDKDDDKDKDKKDGDSDDDKQCQLKDGPYTSINEIQKIQIPVSTAANNVIIRDYRVLNDPLYPPVNRPDIPTAIHESKILRLNDNVNDKYRLIGYLINTNDKDDGWKLYARSTNLRRGSALFYVMPTDKTKDIKISLTNNIVKGRLDNMYDLPSEIEINHPMFRKDSYEIITLSQADLDRSY